MPNCKVILEVVDVKGFCPFYKTGSKITFCEPAILKEVLLRAPNEAQHEDEAETLAALIQKQVIRHERLQQLAVTVSSDDSMRDHFTALGLI